MAGALGNARTATLGACVHALQDRALVDEDLRDLELVDVGAEVVLGIGDGRQQHLLDEVGRLLVAELEQVGRTTNRQAAHLVGDDIASIAGKEGNPNASAYAAAKGGVIAMTKAVGKECAKFDIAINCITPATAKTRILDELKPEFIDYMLSRIPRGRFVEVEEVANMVSWLVSKENSFTTASVFDLSGGRATY